MKGAMPQQKWRGEDVEERRTSRFHLSRWRSKDSENMGGPSEGRIREYLEDCGYKVLKTAEVRDLECAV
jgi:hypothetical protein